MNWIHCDQARDDAESDSRNISRFNWDTEERVQLRARWQQPSFINLTRIIAHSLESSRLVEPCYTIHNTPPKETNMAWQLNGKKAPTVALTQWIDCRWASDNSRFSWCRQCAYCGLLWCLVWAMIDQVIANIFDSAILLIVIGWQYVWIVQEW